MEKYTNVCDWIEKIIDSCDISKREQEKICDKLISNFTNRFLFVNNNFTLYNIYEKKLRKKLLTKFYTSKN